MANHVARRAALIDPPADRAALYWVQWRSWQPGGLDFLAGELLRNYPRENFSEEMRHHTCGQWAGGDPLKPSTPFYRLRKCLDYFCLDPDYPLVGLWETIDDYRQKWIESRAKGVVQTEIGEQVAAALTYAHEARTMVIINGVPGLGKSHAAHQFCELSGGLMRYVGLRSTTDMSSFLREICKALGLATNLNLKAQVLDERIQGALASGDLSLCFDEAHYLWPQGRLRCAVPAKLNWILTTLCNAGLPVALITTPQWDTAQAELEKQTAWSSSQLKGRVGLTASLPTEISAADLGKVAACICPGADARIIAALVDCSVMSKENLRPIKAIATRAAWLAQKDGRKTAGAADFKQAIRDNPVSAYLTEKKSPDEAPTVPARARRGGFAARPRPRGGITTKTFSRFSAPALELVKT